MRIFRSCAQTVHGKPLVYLDNANTTQKPQAVIDALVRYYTRVQRQYPSRHPPAERAGDAGLRGRAGQGQAVPERRGRPTRSSSSATRPRASTWSRRPSGGRTSARATRSSSRRWSITATSCPGRCSARRRARRCASSRSTTPANCCWTSTRSCSTPRTKFVGIVHMSNALGTINPVKRDHRHGPRARRSGPGGWRAVGLSHAARRAGPGLRLPRLLRA